MSAGRAAAIKELRDALDKLEAEPANDAPKAPDIGDAATLARLLELRAGELQVALARLDKLEAMITRQGGHMPPEDQRDLRDARDVLEHHGIRKVTRTVWVDRK